MVEWPSWSCTTLRSAPAARATVAAPCRSPCSVTGGSPEAATSFANRRVIRSGRNGVPVVVVYTYPVSVQRFPGGASLGPLPDPVLAQRGDGGLVQRDDPASGVALRRPGDQPAAELLQLPRHGQGPRVEVEVAPPQAGGLAAARPAQRDEVKQRV